MKEQQMLSEGDKVVIGLSGGPDSVCLFSVLNEVREQLDLQLIAVHLNHGLRAEAADGDERFVKELCHQHQVELISAREDVKAYAQQNKLSSEEAGRILRRRLFEETMKARGADKIALGHHQDDNAETFIFNLCRGSGVWGLTGIKPVNLPYIRPLLCLQKQEIMNYLEERQLAYRIDQTNYEDEFMRNKIRNHVLPYLSQHVNAQTVEHINQSTKRLADLASFAQEELDKYVAQGLETGPRGRVLIREQTYRSVPQALKSEFVLAALKAAAGEKKDLRSVHVGDVTQLFAKQVGRALDLPYDIQARRTYDGVSLGKKIKSKKKTSYSPKMRTFGVGETSEKIPSGSYTKWFDYGRIKDSLVIRNREAGDYLTIHKNGDKKKLKQFFVDEKIDREKRAEIPLVCDGSHVMWVVGYRQNPYYQVSESTKTILEISFEKETK